MHVSATQLLLKKKKEQNQKQNKNEYNIIVYDENIWEIGAFWYILYIHYIKNLFCLRNYVYIYISHPDSHDNMIASFKIFAIFFNDYAAGGGMLVCSTYYYCYYMRWGERDIYIPFPLNRWHTIQINVVSRLFFLL